ncbi:MAG TPA: RNA 3'-terminal phosphate cyclase [Phycisphaerae bacterium]|nr:RNA 3'-terminal phosphate cyclase [Phycisphaerae bacterium]HNU46830.1 RNA 3'-terminal phosphate cyclase [Phycisphaerae bacterium]
MLTIDGSFGEGGGQILRTALALSLLTGQPLRLERIRARREKPGLRQQHLTAVNAATQISGARVTGAALTSQTLTFEPGRVQPGAYEFDVGTAGSTTLVLQTILPPLLLADRPSTLVLKGGTHNPLAPPFDFLEQAFLPLVERMGPSVQVRLERCGFYPAGGGIVTVRVEPVARLAPLDLRERGRLHGIRARALVARLPRHIAERELQTVRAGLGLNDEQLEVVDIADTAGPGNVVTIAVASAEVTEVFTGFGIRGRPAERVAQEVVRQVRDYLDAGVPVGPYLADQLLLPLALAGGGALLTVPPTPHSTTNIEVIRRLVPVSITAAQVDERACLLEVANR